VNARKNNIQPDVHVWRSNALKKRGDEKSELNSGMLVGEEPAESEGGGKCCRNPVCEGWKKSQHKRGES